MGIPRWLSTRVISCVVEHAPQGQQILAAETVRADQALSTNQLVLIDVFLLWAFTFAASIKDLICIWEPDLPSTRAPFGLSSGSKTGRGWTKQGVDFIGTLNGSASSPPVSIVQVFEMVFLSGISEMVVVSPEQHSL